MLHALGQHVDQVMTENAMQHPAGISSLGSSPDVSTTEFQERMNNLADSFIRQEESVNLLDTLSVGPIAEALLNQSPDDNSRSKRQSRIKEQSVC